MGFVVDFTEDGHKKRGKGSKYIPIGKIWTSVFFVKVVPFVLDILYPVQLTLFHFFLRYNFSF